MRCIVTTFLLVSLGWMATEACAEPLPRAQIFAVADKADVQLSPDGKTLSYLAVEADRVNIWTASVGSPESARPLIVEAGQSVFRYQWAPNSQAIIYQTGRFLPFWKENKTDDDFVIYRIDVETGTRRALTPKLDRRVKFFTSPQRPDEIFVSPSERGPAPRQAKRINIYTGETKLLEESSGMAPVYPDQQLRPRFATRWGESGGIDLLTRAAEGDWTLRWSLNSQQRPAYRFFGIDGEDRRAYVAATSETSQAALMTIDLETGDKEQLAASSDGEITSILVDQTRQTPIAYQTTYLRSRWTALDPQFEAAIQFLNRFDEGDWQVISQSSDDSTWLVEYDDAVRPPHYYWFDRSQLSAKLLFSQNARLAQAKLSRMHPLEITARDGLVLPCYLVLPPGIDWEKNSTSKKSFPLVVWVHGGPVARVSYEFIPEFQWLAQRGYAVLAVNYRGSAGFGSAFVEASYGEWGRKMQTDLVDAIRWSIDQRITKPGKIAVIGTSYGGFAALNALADAPNEIACGVEIVGLTDLNLFLDTLASYEPMIKDDEQKRAFLSRLDRDRKQIGDDERTPEGRKGLDARSPLHRAEEIAQPILIVHGKKDQGVLPKHSEAMVAALEAADQPVTYLTYANEGHGILRHENWISLAAILESFLQTHLGGKAEPIRREELSEAALSVETGGERIPQLSSMLSDPKDE